MWHVYMSQHRCSSCVLEYPACEFRSILWSILPSGYLLCPRCWLHPILWRDFFCHMICYSGFVAKNSHKERAVADSWPVTYSMLSGTLNPTILYCTVLYCSRLICCCVAASLLELHAERRWEVCSKASLVNVECPTVEQTEWRQSHQRHSACYCRGCHRESLGTFVNTVFFIFSFQSIIFSGWAVLGENVGAGPTALVYVKKL